MQAIQQEFFDTSPLHAKVTKNKEDDQRRPGLAILFILFYLILHYTPSSR